MIALLRSRLRMLIFLAVLVGVTAGGGCATAVQAAIISWVGPCEYWSNSIWQWMWNCPDVPTGGGSGGGW